MPPHMQFKVQVLLSVGMFPSITSAVPGTHGVAVTGIHGTGVNTPKAAAVAEATMGFDGVVHMANGGILTIGIWSMIFAAGMLLVKTRFSGNTINDDGAVPKLQVIWAPIQTCCGMLYCFV